MAEPRANSLAARRAKYEPEPRAEPTEIILSVRLDNGAFEASVRVPLSEAANFDEYTARWLKLTHAALAHGVEEMRATLSAQGDGT